MSDKQDVRALARWEDEGGRVQPAVEAESDASWDTSMAANAETHGRIRQVMEAARRHTR
jgi:hypothetical protein